MDPPLLSTPMVYSSSKPEPSRPSREAPYTFPRWGPTGGACFHFRLKPWSSSTSTIIQTPICPLLPIRGVQWIQRLRPSSSALETHRTFAVTPRPSARADVSSSRTRDEPPILFIKGDCRIPGTRRVGDANKIRKDGYGRIRRYFAPLASCFSTR